MKSKLKSSCSLILTVFLVVSSKLTDARPHAHGVFENLRRLVLPLKDNFNDSLAPTVGASGYGREVPSSILPILPTAIHGQGQANVTVTAPFHIPSHQPGPKPLELMLQDHRQTLHHGAHPVFHHHGAHHKHTTKASAAAAAVVPTASSVGTATQVTKVTHVARQVQTVSNNPNGGAYQSWVLAGFADPTSTSASTASSRSTLLCPDHNGTVFRSSSGITYQTVCGINYRDDIKPSIHVDSFEACIQKCDAYNWDMHGVNCVAAWYTPTNSRDQVDCVLKSSLTHSVYNESSDFVNAVRYSVAQSAHLRASTTSSALLSSLSEGPTATTHSSLSRSRSSSASSPIVSSTVSPPGVTYGTGNSVITPKVAGSKLHGPSENRPTSQYIQYDPADGIALSRSLLRPGVNGDLSTGYDISPQTGVLEVNIYTQNALAPLKNVPHLSRDGGRGGYINGQHIFLFCDTGSYSGTTLAQNGDFLDFVSSSVAVDVGMNALSGNPIRLQDGVGEWSDNVGRQRGFVPLTQGEQAYNIAMQGQGQRYAIWIESSIIPLDAETGLIYAPIVYDNVNMVTREAIFTYTGNTILRITAGGRGGPVAQRPVRKLFDQDQPEWGVAGGLRSWGPSGIGGRDGKVYLFGGVSGGMLMARVEADSIEDRDAYEYWSGSSWSTVMPGKTNKAFFIEGPIMDIDVFYSPRHLTFIAVYLTIYADSTFYYRYLKADHAIMPGYGPGGDQNSDCVESLLKYEWSDEQVLYKAKPGLSGSFIYSGGIHTRYFGADDIANGGSRMLLSWTAPTGQNPASAVSEYQIVTAEVNFA
ncbi:MAG: hypothetical protein LQ343_001911 [Gyalolechia ehrenbergii]|nr:MAG: hypothetical protein LQ343_001911 [Gyalolechia ehrenbergii]